MLPDADTATRRSGEVGGLITPALGSNCFRILAASPSRALALPLLLSSVRLADVLDEAENSRSSSSLSLALSLSSSSSALESSLFEGMGCCDLLVTALSSAESSLFSSSEDSDPDSDSLLCRWEKCPAWPTSSSPLSSTSLTSVSSSPASANSSARDSLRLSFNLRSATDLESTRRSR